MAPEGARAAPALSPRLLAAAVEAVCGEIPQGFRSATRVEAPRQADGQALASALAGAGRLGADVVLGGPDGRRERSLVLAVDRLGQPDAASWCRRVHGELAAGGLLIALEPDVGSWRGRWRLLRRGPQVEMRLRPDSLRQTLFDAGFRWLLERPAPAGRPWKVVLARAGVPGGTELG